MKSAKNNFCINHAVNAKKKNKLKEKWQKQDEDMKNLWLRKILPKVHFLQSNVDTEDVEKYKLLR